VSDRVGVTLALTWPELDAAIETHRSLIARETLATSIEVATDVAAEPNAEVDGRPIHVTVTKR
jgi:hypothetical protein